MNQFPLRFLSFTAVFAAALAVSFAAVAQQYKWVDKDGRVQYGDSPPPGVKATPLRPPAGPAAPTSSAGKTPTTAEKDADFRKRQLEAGKARDKEANAAQNAALKKQNCAMAQNSVRTLEQGRVRRLDANGEAVYLDDNQLVQEMARAKKSVVEWCG
jgi:hypothetical protein